MKTPLLEATLILANNRPIGVNMTEVCRAAGSSKRWFNMVQSGGIKDPGGNRLQRLHDTLIEFGATIPEAKKCA
jgi:hypothetical protein